jgi:type II secretory pathway pseudopilin PulG
MSQYASNIRRSAMAGFTLVEIFIAMIILAGAIITLSASWSGNLVKLTKSKRHDIATYLLEKKISEIFAEYEGKPLNSIKDEDKGDFGSEYKGFRWEFKSQELILPDMKALYTANNNEEPDQMTSLVLEQMRGFMEKSVKEIQVSIFAHVQKSQRAKKGRKEARYTVSTYIVDYNQELDIGAAAASLGGGDSGGESSSGEPSDEN